MFCVKCGTKIDGRYDFCRNCGTKKVENTPDKPIVSQTIPKGTPVIRKSLVIVGVGFLFGFISILIIVSAVSGSENNTEYVYIPPESYYQDPYYSDDYYYEDPYYYDDYYYDGYYP